MKSEAIRELAKGYAERIEQKLKETDCDNETLVGINTANSVIQTLLLLAEIAAQLAEFSERRNS